MAENIFSKEHDKALKLFKEAKELFVSTNESNIFQTDSNPYDEATRKLEDSLELLSKELDRNMDDRYEGIHYRVSEVKDNISLVASGFNNVIAEIRNLKYMIELIGKRIAYIKDPEYVFLQKTSTTAEVLDYVRKHKGIVRVYDEWPHLFTVKTKKDMEELEELAKFSTIEYWGPISQHSDNG